MQKQMHSKKSLIKPKVQQLRSKQPPEKKDSYN